MQLKVNSVWVQNIPLLKVIRSSRNIFFGYFFIRNLFFFLKTLILLFYHQKIQIQQQYAYLGRCFQYRLN